MRVAWFSPLPPDTSGIAAYSADVLTLLDNPNEGYSIDRFVDRPHSVSGPGSGREAPQPAVFDAHDFVWKQQRGPYDLIVYQLGNARWHDYMWAYMVAYPGLVVLHDVRVHHARALQLLKQGRADDYRREFRYGHPGAPPGVEEYAVEGLSGSIYYFWSMLQPILRTARLVAVHNARVAADLREEIPGLRVDTIRMGVPASLAHEKSMPDARETVRRQMGIRDGATLFVAFGHVTIEKRIAPILTAIAALVAGGADAHLMLVGQATGLPSLTELIERQGLTSRVHQTGYVADERVPTYLAAADACLCLRWPTAGETSASWLRALAASKPTVVTRLAHLADVPTLDATTWRPSHASLAPVAISVDLLEEEAGVLRAMSALVADGELRSELSRSGRAYWSREHGIELMAEDYRRIMRDAAALVAPRPEGLPSHFTADHSSLALGIAGQMGVEIEYPRPP
jgi:glycosyltransferase involved in cell wall biosynthesis